MWLPHFLRLARPLCERVSLKIGKTNYEMAWFALLPSWLFLISHLGCVAVCPRCAYLTRAACVYGSSVEVVPRPVSPRFHVMHHFGLIATQIVGIKPGPKVMFMLCACDGAPGDSRFSGFGVLGSARFCWSCTAYSWQFCDIYLHVCIGFYLPRVPSIGPLVVRWTDKGASAGKYWGEIR